jgi:two-component system, NarL family, sensor histidine kinase DesK
MSWLERWGKFGALACLALMWPLADAYMRGTVQGARAAIFLAIGATYCVTFVWYVFRGYVYARPRVPVAMVSFLTVLALALDHLQGEIGINYFLIPLLIAGFGLAPRRAAIALSAVGLVTMVDGIVLAHSLTGTVVLQTVLVAPGVLLFGGSAMGLRYLLSTLAALRAARTEIVQHATDNERARISRDLHDLLGNSLSLITLKGELATRLLPEGAPGLNEVRDMLSLSREALRQVREAVSGYRQPTLSTELTAARVALEAGGVEVEIKQDVGALNRETEAVLGWVVREATTNVIRHSGARRCRIAFSRDPAHVQVDVVNDGWRVPQSPAGNGLRGLAERLAAVGGEVEATAQPHGGFRLRATVPTPGSGDLSALDVEVVT